MQQLLISMACLTCFAIGGHADVLETPAQGLIRIEVSARSKALVGSPLHRTPVFSGTVGGVVDNWLSPTVNGSTIDWEDGIYSMAESGWLSHYVLILDGDYEGVSFPVLDNVGESLELDLDTSIVEELKGLSFQLIPYWTLNTLFGEQAEFGAASRIDGKDATTEIQLFSPEAARNKKPEMRFFYYDGLDYGGPGWRLVDGKKHEIFDELEIAPGDCTLFVNTAKTSCDLVLPGTVQMTRNVSFVSDLGIPNDEYMALTQATPVTLADSMLIESGAFRGSPTISGSRGDLLLTFSDGSVRNRHGMGKYYYYTGSAFGGEGWRRRGRSPRKIYDEVEVFKPGYGFAIRKTNRGEDSAYLWSFAPDYLLESE